MSSEKNVDEKPRQSLVEVADEPVPLDAEDLELSPEEERKLLRRVDLKVLPLVTVLYLLSFLDRVNIGQANVSGLSRDLKITSIEYQISLIVFFVGYVAIELPFNLILKRWKPPIVIGVSMVAWGIVMTLMSLVQSASGLQAARFFLGFTEGGLFPGINLLLSCWYSRKEQNLRVAIFFAGATLAGAFGGALAYGISKMDGIGGLEGWRWIFLLEGILTILVALLAFRYLVNFPEEEKRLLTPLEARKWKHRLAQSQGITNVDLGFNWAHINKAFVDWRAWAFTLLYMGILCPLYSLALFTPAIVRDLGISTPTVSNLLIVPPYTVGFFTCLGVGWLSDRSRMRSPFIIGCMAVCAIGYILLISVKSAPVKYFAVHLAVAGVSPSVACSIAFVASAFGPHLTRATALGMFFVGGNAMGIVSSVIYPASQGPRYVQGHSVNLACAGVTILLATVLLLDNIRQNRKRDAFRFADPDGSDFDHRRATDPDEKIKWGLQDLSDAEVMGLGQNHPAFRFSL